MPEAPSYGCQRPAQVLNVDIKLLKVLCAEIQSTLDAVLKFQAKKSSLVDPEISQRLASGATSPTSVAETGVLSFKARVEDEALANRRMRRYLVETSTVLLARGVKFDSTFKPEGKTSEKLRTLLHRLHAKLLKELSEKKIPCLLDRLSRDQLGLPEKCPGLFIGSALRNPYANIDTLLSDARCLKDHVNKLRQEDKDRLNNKVVAQCFKTYDSLDSKEKRMSKDTQAILTEPSTLHPLPWRR